MPPVLKCQSHTFVCVIDTDSDETVAVQALAGPHFYTWGDHGGILVAIAQGGATTHLK